MNININNINRYLIEQIKQGNFDKEYAFEILKNLNNKSKVKREDIAIVGMACRLPGANTPDEFWQLLKDERNCIRSLPFNREQDALAIFPEGHNVNFFHAGYLDEIDKFDAEYFNIPPRIASLMDPYQRLFLETFIEALQDASINPSQIYGSNTGVFIGTDHTHKFKASYLSLIEQPDFNAMVGSWAGVLTGRISYMYNLKGPGMVVDSACSSGLSSFHAACNALYLGDCDQAIVGGVNIFVMPTTSNGQMDLEDIISSENLVRAFDQKSSGTAWGESVGCFIIKPLSKAIEDKDPIHALIKGIAVNSDGASNGITAPNGKSQIRLIERAWDLANVSADDISYIEAHGTGTKLGDLIEIKSLNEVFKKQTSRKQFCGVGSVKTNIGHAVGGSSIVSLIKVLMAIKNKQLPPTINFNMPNPLIDFTNSALYVQAFMSNWNTNNKPRTAGINAFSFSGTNCHAVISEFVKEKADSLKEVPAIFTLSARSLDLMENTIKTYDRFIKTNPNISLSQLCYSINISRENFNYRLALVVNDINELKEKFSMINPDDIVFCDRDNVQLVNDTKKLLNKKVSNAIDDVEFLEKIKALYLRGGDINWKDLYSEKKIDRIHLPVHPFKKTRYWVETPRSSSLNTPKNTLTLKHITLNGDYSLLGKNVEFIASVWGNILGYPSIDVKSDFYELGGDSILGMQIIMTINKELNLSLELSVLMEFSQFIDFVNNVNKKSINNVNEKIEKIEIGSSIYPTSFAQKRMFFLWQLDKQSLMYNVSGYVVLPRILNIADIELAFKKVVLKHESLRTIFVFNDELQQRILEDVNFKVSYIDLSNSNKQNDIETISNYSKKQIQPFDLEVGPLFRISLILLPNERTALLLDLHHIISDGTSVGTYIKDLETALAGEELSSCTYQYKDYAIWQNNQITNGHYNNHRNYWNSIIDEEMPSLQLPVALKQKNTITSAGKRISFYWDADKKSMANNFAKENSCTTYIFLLGCLNILLSKYSSQSDILIGSPVSCRNHPDFIETTGLFVNTILLRNKPENSRKIIDFFKDVKYSSFKAFNYQDYPFDLVLEQISKGASTDINNLPFNVFFEFQNEDIRVNKLDDTALFVELNADLAKFDISFLAKNDKDKIRFDVEYRTDLFTQSMIEQVMEHYSRICDFIIANKSEVIGNIDYLTNKEKEQHIFEFNNSKSDYPSKKLIIDLFKETVSTFPDKVAVGDNNYQLTYRKLDLMSSYLSEQLISRKITKGDYVGILCGRTIEAVLASIAIMKIGAIYVLLDAESPNDRLDLMISSCDMSTICVIDEYVNRINPNLALKVSLIEPISENVPEMTELVTVSSEDTAYMMYTSGSTGIPKGVLISHKSVVRLVRNTNYFEFLPEVRIIQTSAPGFDASIFEWWGTLLNGGYLHVISKEELMSPLELERRLINYKINTMWLTSSLFNILFDQKDTIFRELDYLLVGGDVLSTHHISKLREKYPALNVYNAYGPTENTVFSLVHYINKDYPVSIPIGIPISNSTVLILDEDQKLLPIGAIGELCFGGDGVAKGYLNDELLTNKKFIENPYGNGKIYRSGDLGRFREDGVVEFFGRKDAQVKIRGFRIEVGEVERIICKHTQIINAFCCIISTETEKCLACYYITNGNKKLSPSDIKEYLTKEVPSYMIPLYYKQMDSFPLNLNGKIDRKKLPKPEIIKREIILPITSLQKKLFKCWKEVLGENEPFGIDDDFFALGGQSLKAMALVNKLFDLEDIGLPLASLFTHTTIRLQEKYIEEGHANVEKLPDVTRHTERQYFPVSSSQKRLFALQELSKESLAYNMPIAFKLNDVFDITLFEGTLTKLISRHSSLRTNFEIKDGEPVQFVNEDTCLAFSTVEASSEEAVDDLIRSFIKPFDLKKDKLFRVQLIKLLNYSSKKIESKDSKTIIVFDMHHIISDGISVKNLANDFITIINGNKLSDLPCQYTDYVLWEKNIENLDIYKSQKDYWKLKLEGDLPVLAIPTDYIRPAQKSFNGNNIAFSFDAELTSRILQINERLNVTSHQLLLSMFKVLLSIYSNQEDIIVGIPVAGRHKDSLKNLVGLFTTTLPIRSYPQHKKSFKTFVREVKDASLEAFDNQLFSLEKIIEEIVPIRDSSRNAIFDVLFVMQENINFGLEEYPINMHIAKFDIMLQAWLQHGIFRFNIEFDTALYSTESINLMSKRFEQLASILVQDIDIPLMEIDLSLPEEKVQILNEFNNTFNNIDYNKTIIEYFRETVSIYPNHIAVKYKGLLYSYSELDKISEYWANYLGNNGVKQGDRVGLYFDRDSDWIISILAILKTGGVYVPIGISYPKERISSIVEIANLKVVLTNKPDNGLFDIPIIDVSGMNQRCLYTEPTKVELRQDGNSPCYIMFTSGSTGEPKGVLALNKNVVRLVKNQDYVPLNSETKILLTGATVFDATTFEIWGALLNGGSLILADNQILLDAVYLEKVIKEEQVNTMWFTSAYFNQLCDQNPYIFQTLAFLLVGGDVLSPKHIYKIKELFEHITIINGYGPTENVTFSTTYKIESRYNNIPIGKPISNSTVFILNKSQKLQPIGIIGELYVGGLGVSGGYINDIELTKNKFIKNPFGEGFLYKTGDLACFLSDGNINFFGRVDNQIKIRGYRIEIGEIENALLSIYGIQKALVIAFDRDGEKNLCAYYQSSENLGPSVVKSYLQNKLPDYLVPVYYVSQPSFAITENGKIDREKLPEPMAIKEKYEKPQNEIESQIADIWTEILHVPQVGRTDNFFSLGGDSIKAIQICSRLQNCNIKLQVSTIFKYPVLKELSLEAEVFITKVDQKEIIGKANLSPIQSWFKNKKFLHPNHFHQGVLINRKEGLNSSIIIRVIEKIIQHHDSLRICFPSNMEYQENLSWRQSTFYNFQEISDRDGSFSPANYQSQFKKMMEKTSLEKGLLTSLLLVHHNGGSHLWWSIHHLVVDGVSWRILLEDFQSLYNAYSLENSTKELPLKTTSFIEWSVKIKEFAKDICNTEELNYWKNETFNTEALTWNKPVSSFLYSSIMSKKFLIESADTLALISKVHHAFSTDIQDLLIAALYLTMRRWKNVNNLQIMMEGHGRENVVKDIDISRTVGWYTSIYPVKLFCKEITDIAEVIKKIKDKIHKIPRKGVGYSILRYLNNDDLKNLKPDISFNYLGILDTISSNNNDMIITPIDSTLSLSRENQAFYKLDINSWIINNQLHVNIDYLSEAISENEIFSFINQFQSTILEIIKCCQSREDTETTISDLASRDITESEFSEIINSFN